MTTRDTARWDMPAERPVEDRLRRALTARADAVGVRDLRPAAPPGPHLRRTRLPRPAFPAWLRPRRLALPLAAAAAAAVLAVAAHLATAPDRDPVRPMPASPPTPATPSPAPATPSPSASSPASFPDPVRTPTPDSRSGHPPRRPPTAVPGTSTPGGMPRQATPTPDRPASSTAYPPAPEGSRHAR
ncbi:hypothetical protein [Streptomyces sp. NPDC093097]|uniref:hypothetical protein n=1 Tax=Streptomyces sp. NPDC093097 TaxID=3366027 RepID=UPI0038272C00